MLNSLKWLLQTSIKSIVLGFILLNFPSMNAAFLGKETATAAMIGLGPIFMNKMATTSPLFNKKNPRYKRLN